MRTSNLSKTHVTCDIIDAAIWGIIVQRALKQCILKEYTQIWGVRMDLLLFDYLVWGKPADPAAARNFVTKSLRDSSRWKFRDPSLQRSDRAPGCDGQTDASQRQKAYMLSRV